MYIVQSVKDFIQCKGHIFVQIWRFALNLSNINQVNNKAD